MSDTLVRQEIHCHACGKFVQCRLDMALNGNHVIECPECGHEHCRVVKDGRITDIRWDQRNGPTYEVQRTYVTAVSTWTQYNSDTCTTSSTATLTATAWSGA